MGFSRRSRTLVFVVCREEPGRGMELGVHGLARCVEDEITILIVMDRFALSDHA